MEKHTLIWLGVVIAVIAVAVAYSAGQSSNTSNTPTQIQTEAKSVATTETPSPTQTTTNSNAITSGSPCEEMANKAAQDEEDVAVGFLLTDMKVTQSHVKNGQCYYELSYHATGGSSGDGYITQINQAPNNTEIAYCGREVGGTVCFGISNGKSTVMSATIFHTIETDLLTN